LLKDGKVKVSFNSGRIATFAPTIALMNCLLLSATAKEIKPFLDFYRNNDNKPDVDILITGIGLTAATYVLTKQISLKKPGLIIQAGVAGCFDKNISLASVVVVKQETVADLSVIENKRLKTMFDLKLIALNQSPYRKGWMINPNYRLVKRTGLKEAVAISVNHVTTSKQMITFYRKKFHPVIESMEGAALHYVCIKEKIPFLQIRGVSNYIGERDKKKWKMKEAISNLNKELIGFLNKL